MSNLQDLKKWSDAFKNQDKLQPALFIGHGSPMNAIEDNEFTQNWEQLGKTIPLPKAVLCISAHWLTQGTHITAMDFPKTIHDFGGFPQDLFNVEYPAKGSPFLAKNIQQEIHSVNVHLDHEWGLDHGTWSVVKHMYPNANIPVLQLSIDYSKPPEYHYQLATELSRLRKKGILIIGSGNMIHNLRMVAWDKMNEPEYGYDWALELNDILKTKIEQQEHNALINYQNLHKAAALAIPTPDHYYPLLYSLGLQSKNEAINIFNDKAIGGSITMTSVKIG